MLKLQIRRVRNEETVVVAWVLMQWEMNRISNVPTLCFLCHSGMISAGLLWVYKGCHEFISIYVKSHSLWVCYYEWMTLSLISPWNECYIPLSAWKNCLKIKAYPCLSSLWRDEGMSPICESRGKGHLVSLSDHFPQLKMDYAPSPKHLCCHNHILFFF